MKIAPTRTNARTVRFFLAFQTKLLENVANRMPCSSHNGSDFLNGIDVTGHAQILTFCSLNGENFKFSKIKPIFF